MPLWVNTTKKGNYTVLKAVIEYKNRIIPDLNTVKFIRNIKKVIYKPNYPKQSAKLSSTNLTKTCFSWMPCTQYLKNQKFKWANSFNWLTDLSSLISQGRLFQITVCGSLLVESATFSTVCIFCLQVDGFITGGLLRGGERSYNWLLRYVSF